MELTPFIREVLLVSSVLIFLGMILYCTIISDKDPAWMKNK